MRRRNVQKRNFILKVVVVTILVCTATVSVAGFIFFNAKQQSRRQEQTQQETEAAKVKAEVEAAAAAKVEQDVIYDNIFINDVNVGGLTKAEALKKLDSIVEQPVAEKKITVVKGDESYPFTFKELGFQSSLKEAVETAWDYARTGSEQERYDKIMKLEGQPYKITAKYSFDENVVKERVSALGEKFYIEPMNAAMTKKDGAFQVTKEAVGEKLNVEATSKKILQMLEENVEGVVDAVMEEATPEYTASDLANAQSLLGSYSTSFSAGENGRNTNLRTACEKINGALLYPGEIFSTNAEFGAMTYDNGYRPAPVIINGKLEDDFGGGVCQVSSTLYMALLHAELEITERRNHSLKVGYLPYAYDATLAGDYIDLKFRNNTDTPVYIEALIQSGSKVLVNVYGKETRSPNRKLVFQNALVDTIAPPVEEVIQDNGLPSGERLVSTAAKTGYKYNLYKIVYEADKEVERVLVNTSTYRAVRGQVRVGTGPANLAVDTGIDQEPEPPQEVPAPESAPDPAPESAPDPVEETPQPPAIADPDPETTNAPEQPEIGEPSEVIEGPLMSE